MSAGLAIAFSFVVLAAVVPGIHVWAGGTPESGSLPVSGDVLDVHDPSLAKSGNIYYLFSTGPGIPVRSSPDLRIWHDAGRVFDTMPLWAAEDIPAADSIWAPDVSHLSGEYRLYYAVSTFGSNRSEIGLATNTTLDPSSPAYRWVDRGVVVASKPSDDWNCVPAGLAARDRSSVHDLPQGFLLSVCIVRLLLPWGEQYVQCSRREITKDYRTVHRS